MAPVVLVAENGMELTGGAPCDALLVMVFFTSI